MLVIFPIALPVRNERKQKNERSGREREKSRRKNFILSSPNYKSPSPATAHTHRALKYGYK